MRVIDSVRSGHGDLDTRHARDENGNDHDGLGEGVLRVYVAKEGMIAGYIWSTIGTNFVSQSEKNMVIGRFNL